MIFRAAACIAIFAGISILAASAHAEAQVPTRLAYSANVGNDSVGVFAVAPATGALALVGTVPTGGDPRAVAVDVSGRFVYVANPDENRVSAFRIDAASGLVPLTPATATNPVALALEPTGRFVYAASGNTGEIAKFQIRTNGTLLARGVEDAGLRAIALAVHPSGRFLYCIDAESARVLAYTIDAATGDLQLFSAPLLGETGPNALAIEPRGRTLYVLHDLDDLVTVFRINAQTGALTQTQQISVKNPVAVVVEQTGRFLYVASPENNALFAYAISQADGTLTHADTEVLALTQPISVTVDPTNRFLYAASVVADRVTRLSINPATGVMTEGPSVPGGGRPLALAMAHPSERFLYTSGTPVQNGNQALEGFRIGAADGALTSVDDFGLNDLATELVVEPSGRFAYVLNVNDHTIETFGVDVSTGALTNLQTLTMPNPVGGSSALTVEPTGRFLYVACFCNSATNASVRAFGINATTGLLTDLGGSGGTGNLFANSGVVDLTGRFLYFANAFSPGVQAFAIDQTSGLVTALSLTPIDTAVAQLAMDPTGRFLYVVRFNGTVQAFRASSTTGALTAAGSVTLNAVTGGGATVDRTGRFFFVLSSPGQGGSVHSFLIDQATGALQASGNPPVFLGNNIAAEWMVTDATGRFIHVGHGIPTPTGAKGIRTFSIEPVTGAVTSTSNAPTPFPPTQMGTTGRIR